MSDSEIVPDPPSTVISAPGVFTPPDSPAPKVHSSLDEKGDGAPPVENAADDPSEPLDKSLAAPFPDRLTVVHSFDVGVRMYDRIRDLVGWIQHKLKDPESKGEEFMSDKDGASQEPFKDVWQSFFQKAVEVEVTTIYARLMNAVDPKQTTDRRSTPLHFQYGEGAAGILASMQLIAGICLLHQCPLTPSAIHWLAALRSLINSPLFPSRFLVVPTVNNFTKHDTIDHIRRVQSANLRQRELEPYGSDVDTFVRWKELRCKGIRTGEDLVWVPSQKELVWAMFIPHVASHVSKSRLDEFGTIFDTTSPYTYGATGIPVPMEWDYTDASGKPVDDETVHDLQHFIPQSELPDVLYVHDPDRLAQPTPVAPKAKEDEDSDADSDVAPPQNPIRSALSDAGDDSDIDDGSVAGDAAKASEAVKSAELELDRAHSPTASGEGKENNGNTDIPLDASGHAQPEGTLSAEHPEDDAPGHESMDVDGDAPSGDKPVEGSAQTAGEQLITKESGVRVNDTETMEVETPNPLPAEVPVPEADHPSSATDQDTPPTSGETETEVDDLTVDNNNADAAPLAPDAPVEEAVPPPCSKPIRYRRIDPRGVGNPFVEAPPSDPPKPPAHLTLSKSKSIGTGHSARVWDATIEFQRAAPGSEPGSESVSEEATPQKVVHESLGGAPLPKKLSVAAKLPMSYQEGRDFVDNEARIYSLMNPDLSRTYNGYLLTVKPRGQKARAAAAVTPKFYGYYVPDDENAVEGQKAILLMEKCGEPIVLTDESEAGHSPELDDQGNTVEKDIKEEDWEFKLGTEQKEFLFHLLQRFHAAGFTQNSFSPRNILVQPGPLYFPPSRRSLRNPSFRIIDFGRGVCHYLDPTPERHHGDWEPPLAYEERRACELLGMDPVYS